MKRIATVGMVALALALHPAAGVAGGKPLVISGAGTASLTDPDLNLEALGINLPPRGGNYPLAFAIAGVMRADGTAKGVAEFVFGHAFSHVFDADVIVLTCKITGGKVNVDGTITLTGVSYESDWALGQGVFFEETSPFEMVIANNGQFTLRWCAFPGDFAVQVTRGKLSVR